MLFRSRRQSRFRRDRANRGARFLPATGQPLPRQRRLRLFPRRTGSQQRRSNQRTLLASGHGDSWRDARESPASQGDRLQADASRIRGSCGPAPSRHPGMIAQPVRRWPELNLASQKASRRTVSSFCHNASLAQSDPRPPNNWNEVLPRRNQTRWWSMIVTSDNRYCSRAQ